MYSRNVVFIQRCVSVNFENITNSSTITMNHKNNSLAFCLSDIRDIFCCWIMFFPLLFHFGKFGSFPTGILILHFFPHRKLAWPSSNNIFVETHILLRITIEIISVETVFACACSFSEPNYVFELLQITSARPRPIEFESKEQSFMTNILGSENERFKNLWESYTIL